MQQKTHAPCDVAFKDEEYTPNAYNTPYITCASYCVINPDKNRVLFGKKSDEVREMASLTKIMTAIVTMDLASELKLNLKSTWFKVSKQAAETIGTTANLIEN